MCWPGFELVGADVGTDEYKNRKYYVKSIGCKLTAVIQAAVAEVKRKKALPAVNALKLQNFTEGLCAQIFHVGPFSEEGPTIQRVHDFIGARSGLAGKHHEVYLSDIRRADPAKWKTIIRQPME